MEAIGLSTQRARTIRDVGVGLAVTYLIIELLACCAEFSQGATFASVFKERGVRMVTASAVVVTLASGEIIAKKVQEKVQEERYRELISTFSGGKLLECTICLDYKNEAWVAPMNGKKVEGCYHYTCLRHWIVNCRKTTLPNSKGSYSRDQLNAEPTFTDTEIKALMLSDRI